MMSSLFSIKYSSIEKVYTILVQNLNDKYTYIQFHVKGKNAEASN